MVKEEDEMKILFVYNHDSTWTREDLSILKKYFDVETYFYKKDKRRKNIGKLVKESDIVFIWFASYHALKSTFLAKKYNKKVVTVASGYSVANVPEYKYGLAAKFYTRWIPKYIIKNSNAVIAVSESNQKEILEVFPHENIVLIPHGFYIEKFKMAKKKEKMVITVGAVDKTSIKRKGIDKFVKVADYFDIPFLVIGKIKVDIEKTFGKIPQNVKFTGFVPDEELLKLYQQAKVYAQFSFHEAFGCSVAEAVLCGCVPVVTNKYALPEVVGKYGFVVNYWNEDEAVDKIEEALNSSQEIGERARERIIENYSMEKREERLKELMEEMVRR